MKRLWFVGPKPDHGAHELSFQGERVDYISVPTPTSTDHSWEEFHSQLITLDQSGIMTRAMGFAAGSGMGWNRADPFREIKAMCIFCARQAWINNPDENISKLQFTALGTLLHFSKPLFSLLPFVHLVCWDHRWFVTETVLISGLYSS